MLVEKILSSATEPMDPGIQWDLNPKVYDRLLYVSHGHPKAFLGDQIVLLGNGVCSQPVAYTPEKVVEFDFLNELEGFVQENQLKYADVDYSILPPSAYVVDIDNMILYKYQSHVIAADRRSKKMD